MVHVEDLANLYVLAVEKAPRGTLLHACPVRGIRVREIAEAIAQVMGIPGKVRPWPLVEARHTLGSFADALALDAQASGTVAERLLGWKPTKRSVLEEIEHGSYARLAGATAT
jgi:nucleoside-diphosphate-sugar epimerase